MYTYILTVQQQYIARTYNGICLCCLLVVSNCLLYASGIFRIRWNTILYLIVYRVRKHCSWRGALSCILHVLHVVFLVCWGVSDARISVVKPLGIRFCICRVCLWKGQYALSSIFRWCLSFDHLSTMSCLCLYYLLHLRLVWCILSLGWHFYSVYVAWCLLL